jgi:hypothetical protein
MAHSVDRHGGSASKAVTEADKRRDHAGRIGFQPVHPRAGDDPVPRKAENELALGSGMKDPLRRPSKDA